MKIKKGDIIQSKKWDEPILVEFVEDLGKFIRIVGKKRKTGLNFEDILTEDELKEIQIVKQKLNFSGNSEKVFLALEEKRYRFLSL